MMRQSLLVSLVWWFASMGLAGQGANEPVDPNNCAGCHLDHGVGGHAPPGGPGCLGCHSEGPETLIPSSGHAPVSRGTAASCLSCHPTHPEGEESPSVTHPPYEQGDCLSCHDPHDRSKRKAHLVSRDESPTCERCHEPLKDTRFTHTVVGLGWCSSCHSEHGGGPGLLEGGTNGSCPECHPAQSDAEIHDHWPAATGQCDTCHDPHGSDNPSNLHLPVKETCEQCHPPKDTDVQVHSAVVLGRCSTCHDPHGSPYDRKLRAEPVAEVCFQCHADDITGRKVVHAPVAEGRCTMCHDPHTTGFAKNLRAPVNTTCTMCHPDKERSEVLTPHPAVETYGCATCHDPHASDNEFRLRKPIVALCTSCHAGFDDGYHVVQIPTGGGHPIGGRPDPLREGRELTCTSCHDPHGTENPRMWYRAYQRLALCVECHRPTLAPHTKPGESIFEREAEAARERARIEREGAGGAP